MNKFHLLSTVAVLQYEFEDKRLGENGIVPAVEFQSAVEGDGDTDTDFDKDF